MINLLVELDKKLGALHSEQEKKELLNTMFQIECRYNLDLLDVIKDEAVNQNNDQTRTIVKLLSNKALETIITHHSVKADSLIINTSYSIINIISNFLDENLSPDLNNNDPLLFKLYKRINVLKALATIEPPYTSINEIKFNVRLKNLHRAILEINSKLIQ